MKKIFYAGINHNGTDYQMDEINEAAYSADFGGDVAAYIEQNIELDELGLELCEGDNLGDIQQNFGPYNPENICVIRDASGDPFEVWFTAKVESPIARARKAAGLTQQELADKLGVIQQQVAKWEAAGANPQTKTLKRIAEALGCSIDDLIED